MNNEEFKMAVINTNIAATMTTNALARNDRDMAATMERLSTGKSINSAKDDAAGLAVSSRMTAQIRGLDRQHKMLTMRSAWCKLRMALPSRSAI